MAALTDTLLDVRHLTKRFGGVLALDDVSFSLKRGEVHALCGENGAGKSTLIKCLSGVWPAGSYEGQIVLHGEQTDFRGVADSERAGIAVIYQELALVPQMTVAENIYLGEEPTRAGLIDWGCVYSRTSDLLKRYGLDLDPAARVAQLGIGQQQLVEIVKALAKNSQILLLDEPTAALTEAEVDILLRIVRELRKQGITCVYISHKLDEVMAIADTITVLRDGRSVCTHAREHVTQDDVIRHMVGREIGNLFPRKTSSTGRPLLSVEDLTVVDEQTGLPVVQNVSFEVAAGEVLGIGGLMGAGRTELMSHIFAGRGRRTGGRVTLDGLDLRDVTPGTTIAAGMMMVTEDRKRSGLVPNQSIGFNLSLASLMQFTSAGGWLNRHREVRRNQDLFDTLGIRAPGQETAVQQLSGGNQQKVVLGKALMTEPKVILLDEPTRGIDVGAKQEVYQLINRLTETGKAVVLVSSEMPELMGMSDRMVILSEGRVGGSFTRGEASPEAILKAAMAHSQQAAGG